MRNLDLGFLRFLSLLESLSSAMDLYLASSIALGELDREIYNRRFSFGIVEDFLSGFRTILRKLHAFSPYSSLRYFSFPSHLFYTGDVFFFFESYQENPSNLGSEGHH